MDIYTRKLKEMSKHLSVRILLLALVISTGVIVSTPKTAQAISIFDAIPGIVNIFASNWGNRNPLPIYNVQIRALSEQEILQQVCAGHGYGDDCAKALLGMMWKESLNDSGAIGDRGLARGYFQIHYKMHGVSIACAEDLRCSAEWSLNYMKSNSYPRYAHYAVQCHNGCNAGNGYAASALRHGERLWGNAVPKPKLLANR